MEIPKSLETVWRNVSNDKTIDKSDYDQLIKAASPNGKDEELDQEEINFLTKLKSELEQKGGAKGSVPVDGLSFAQTTPPKVIKESDIGNVPETLVTTWNSAIEDGTIDADDYRVLMDIASPNWNDEELDDKEKAFLGNLQALLKSSGQSLVIEKKSVQTQNNESTKTEDKGYSRTTSEVNTETDDSLKSLNEVNNILDALGNDPDFAPLRTIVNQRLSNSTVAKKFSAEVNQIISEIEPGKIASMNQGKARLKTLYDNLPAGVKANPQISNLYTHAIGTIDSQINAPKNKKNPTSSNTNSTSPKIDVPKDLKTTWDVVAADGKIDKNDYARLLKAASPNGKDEELDQEEINFLTDLKQKVDNAKGIYSFVDDIEDTTENTIAPLVELGEPPDSLKPQIEVLLQKGYIDNDDFNELVNLASPNGKDEEFDSQEKDYLFKLKDKVEQSGGKLYLDPNHQDTPIKTTGKPMLLNWTGYTEENKGALKSAFGNSVSGGNMPILKGSEAIKVAKSFGVSNIRQLQQLVKAKVDGQFGPETFFKAKVYIANEMNKPNADLQRLAQMLNSLGNDNEVESMKANLGLPSNPKTNVEENEDEMTDLNIDSENMGTQQTQSKTQAQSTSSDDGVPKTLKSTWDKVTADGKLTKADFDLLMKAASPNKKNSEFDNDELEFLATVKDMFEKGKTDVLELQKPQGSKSNQQTQSKTQAQSTSSDDGVPKTLKSTWDKVTADGKLTKADFDLLMKAASPNKKNSEFDNEELEFLATVKDMFEKGKTDVLELQKPQGSKSNQQTQSKTQTQSTSSDDGVPKTLKSTWDKVTADGKLTKADFDLLMKAASPNKKNSEFDNQELEFLASIKDMFEKGKTDVLELQKPQGSKSTQKTQTNQTQKPVTVSVNSFNPPQTLKSTWTKAISDGKITNSDFEALMKAAAPNKKNVEFENDEIEFLANLREKIKAAGGTLNISK